MRGGRRIRKGAKGLYKSHGWSCRSKSGRLDKRLSLLIMIIIRTRTAQSRDSPMLRYSPAPSPLDRVRDMMGNSGPVCYIMYMSTGVIEGSKKRDRGGKRAQARYECRERLGSWRDVSSVYLQDAFSGQPWIPSSARGGRWFYFCSLRLLSWISRRPDFVQQQVEISLRHVSSWSPEEAYTMGDTVPNESSPHHSKGFPIRT